MRRAANETDETPGGDSFLDIVANIVGILVLLVVVVGVRAARHVAPAPEPAQQVDTASLEEIERQAEDAVRRAVAVRDEAESLREKLAGAQREAALRDAERAELSLDMERLKAKIENARESLSEDDRRGFEVANQIAQTQLRLDRLSREQIAISMVEPAPESETVVCEPTPIVKGKADDMVSFRVQDDRVVYVPVEELMLEFFLKASAPGGQILTPSRVVTSRHEVGPIEGFVLRGEVGWSVVSRGGRVGARREVTYAELDEATPLRGEPIDQAVLPDGYTMSRIELRDPEETVVRLFIYPDSFDVLPRLEKAIRERGYRIAKSLVSQDKKIAFATDGAAATVQ